VLVFSLDWWLSLVVMGNQQDLILVDVVGPLTLSVLWSLVLYVFGEPDKLAICVWLWQYVRQPLLYSCIVNKTLLWDTPNLNVRMKTYKEEPSIN
jgi:hypothetical protein